MNFRHEWKHEINRGDVLALRARLSAVMEPDPHGIEGRYQIRSLYFDTLEDRSLREKLDGVNNREKFRLRLYNGAPSLVLLEKKLKRDGLCAKLQETLALKDTAALCRNRPEEVAGQRSLLLELASKMTAQGLTPKTIVEYTREAFLFAPGNVRVTLDYNLHASFHCQDFLAPAPVAVPIQSAPAILEVKWDQFLPGLIRDLVQVPRAHTGAFSKYAACRAYG